MTEPEPILATMDLFIWLIDGGWMVFIAAAALGWVVEQFKN